MMAYEVEIRGFVQGQGVRPALQRLANERHWTGSVGNTAKGVRMTIGRVTESLSDVDRLIRQCHSTLGEASLRLRPIDTKPVSTFQIVDSTDVDALAAPVPRDTAVCDECLTEFHDPHNRRFRDPLINCVRCGPRFSALEAMPFDRPGTTLQGFPLCQACQREYGSCDARRGHSQTMNCPVCGPRVWAEDRAGTNTQSGDAACVFASRALLRGQIVAARGVGGYQLLVDATNVEAVDELRHRKRRTTKPFAVLCQSQSEADALGEFDSNGRNALTSPINPIVIVPRKPGVRLAAGIHPHLSEIGLMLPTTALHSRLLELVGRPLVCTSGNLEGAPLSVDVDDARSSLAGIADVWLHHDRPIVHPVDDSVVRPVARRVMTLRCARGLAPLPLLIPNAYPAIALGSFQKSACAYSNGAQSVLGPYVGNLNEVETRTRWDQSRSSLQRLYRIERPLWGADAHPDDVCRTSLPVGANPAAIWHHHAHLVAGMVEHGWLDRSVMGMAADGQGYGPDGTLWGGEILHVSAMGFQRKASLRRFELCGGEAAVRDPSRIAVALLSQLPDISRETISHRSRLDLARTRNLLAGLRSSRSLPTSSLGRLMDGVAWMVVDIQSSGYVGESAMRLDAACDRRATGTYRWKIDDRTIPWELDWRPMLQALLDDIRRGETAGVIAERFHRGIVDWILELRIRCPALPWVFSGGVFQNRRLCELLAERWPVSASPLGLPGVIPVNDGGLAAGQLAILSAQSRARTASQSSRRTRGLEECAWEFQGASCAGSIGPN